MKVLGYLQGLASNGVVPAQALQRSDSVPADWWAKFYVENSRRDAPFSYWLAVDDGSGQPIRAWRATWNISGLNETDVIRARVTRVYGHVRDLEIIADRPAPSVEPTLQQRTT